jgi:hypothetical protein
MKRRFSGKQLYELRNYIPIDVLIEKHLMIPCKHSEGSFRFLCPLCRKFQTGVKAKTNLARCFGCEKNFNTIDMVIEVKKINFVESVFFLQAYRNNLASNCSGNSNPSSKDSKEPVSSIGEIFRKLSLKAG